MLNVWPKLSRIRGLIAYLSPGPWAWQNEESWPNVTSLQTSRLSFSRRGWGRSPTPVSATLGPPLSSLLPHPEPAQEFQAPLRAAVPPTRNSAAEAVSVRALAAHLQRAATHPRGIFSAFYGTE